MNDNSYTSCVIVYTVHSVYHTYVLETLHLTFLHCCTLTPNTQPLLNTLPASVPHKMISSCLAGLLRRLTAEWPARPSGQGWLGPPPLSTLVHSCMHGRTHATTIMRTQLYYVTQYRSTVYTMHV